MKPLVIINIVALTDYMIGENTPHLQKLAATGEMRPLQTVLPAVTCSAQATFTTGKMPSEHGIVGNGWYFRDLSEVWFWRQSNRLVQAPKFWDKAKESRPDLKVAKLFWWYNMYSTADISVTPRPAYFADGKKTPDIYTVPPALKDELQDKLGPFPLFNFWGPTANLKSSRWIGDCTRHIIERDNPDVTLVYLPHLDYNLQRRGPDHPDNSADIREIDKVAGEIIDFVHQRGGQVMVLSEYAILPVSRPVHINRFLREKGYLEIQDNQVGELLDGGRSRAFAVSDHQVAHVYVADESDISPVKKELSSVEGIARVLDRDEQREFGLDHHRSGELVALAEKDSWFTYYYWLDDRRAPDFARTVDIHKKPGYDPVELFVDPSISFPKLKVAGKLLRKLLGLRYLMDVIPLQADLVKGSHGLLTEPPDPRPVFISDEKMDLPDPLPGTDLYSLFLSAITKG